MIPERDTSVSATHSTDLSWLLDFFKSRVLDEITSVQEQAALLSGDRTVDAEFADDLNIVLIGLEPDDNLGGLMFYIDCGLRSGESYLLDSHFRIQWLPEAQVFGALELIRVDSAEASPKTFCDRLQQLAALPLRRVETADLALAGDDDEEA